MLEPHAGLVSVILLKIPVFISNRIKIPNVFRRRVKIAHIWGEEQIKTVDMGSHFNQVPRSKIDGLSFLLNPAKIHLNPEFL